MANRLAEETSPYLLQHKDNPVDWRPWSPEALREARERDVPILVSIGYSACHWCHVMEHESFEDPEAASYMNEHFVPIKVDREERPDIDAIYMDACQAMTGHGGWPLTAFLDPDGVPFHAGTYFPPTPRSGMPSFRQVMEAVVNAWRDQREQITQQAPQIRERLAAVGRIGPSEDPLDRGALDTAIASLREAFDREHGGFGQAPKFPPASALELMLVAGATEEVELTLDRMLSGGIHDQIGGGFARYAVDREWLVPHFEKMLYDNALLARAYLHGYQALGHERYARVCRSTLDWALREMRESEGGFTSALDADSEGEEGRFYVWTPAEIREVLGAEADAVIEHYGVTERGNFEGRNILHLPGGPEAPEPEGIAQARRRLYEARAERVWPERDDKRICSWNALMVAALAEAGAGLGEERYLDAARECAGFLLSQLRDSEGRMLRIFKDGRAPLRGYLEDHAYTVEALLALYEATFEPRWFDAAREIAEVMIERFGDPERGGFFTTADDHEELIARRKDVEDHPIPSGNASAALGLLRLAALSGEGRYRDQAEGVLRILQRPALHHPHAFAHLLQAYAFAVGPVREVAVVGPDPGPLAEVIRSEHRPNVVLAGGPEGSETPELLRHRPAADGQALAYVCEGFTCREPVDDAESLRAQLQAA